MPKLTDISYIKNLLSAFGFTFSKQLGQNFLIDPSVCPKMAELCGCEGIGVIEIGPGIGVLTKELSKKAEKVVSIELDKRLEPVLNVTLKDCDNVNVIFGDAMKLDLSEIIKDRFGDMPVVVCANLPYYITSPLIMQLLESQIDIRAITVMVQLEAAKRICAQCGTRECGALTVAVRAYSDPELLFRVNRGSFMPAPNVDSAVIKLTLKSSPDIGSTTPKNFTKTVRAAFSQRRKQLANSLSSGLSITKQDAIKYITDCGLSKTVRAEQLSLCDFKNLSDIIWSDTQNG